MKHMMIKVLSLLMALTMIMGMFGTMGISAAEEHVHTKGDTVKVVKPTCTSAGYSVYKCSDCGETYESDIVPADKDAHSLKAYYVNGNERGKGAATCTEPAATEGLICARKYCQKVITESEYIKGSEPLGHDYTIELKLPTCEEAGMVYRSCARCVAEELANAEEDVLDQIYSEDEKDGFVYLGTVSNIPAENGVHKYVYEITVAPTCKAMGSAKFYCKLCDEINVENIAVRNTGVAHKYEDVKFVAPTCTTTGMQEHKKCTVCGAQDRNGSWDRNGDGKTNTADLVIPATKHLGHKANDASLFVLKGSAFLSPYSDYAINNGIDAASINTTGITSSVAAALAYVNCLKDAQVWLECQDCGTAWKQEFKAGHQFTSKTAANRVSDKVFAMAEVNATTDGKWYLTAAATCISIPVYTAKCKQCALTQEWAVGTKLTGDSKHVWGTKNSAAAFKPTLVTPDNCAQVTYEIWKCMTPNCGATQEVVIKSAKGHTFYYDCEEVGCPGNDGDNTTSCPTCLHTRTKKCADCTVVNDVIAAATNNPHADENMRKVSVVASCQVLAHDKLVCTSVDCAYEKRLDDTITGSYNPDNHAGEHFVSQIDATCYAEGVKNWKCDCGVKTWTTSIDKIVCDNELVKIPAIAATCNTVGWTEGLYCPDATHGKTITVDVLNNGKVDDPATTTIDETADDVVYNGVVVEPKIVAYDKTNHNTVGLTPVEAVTGTCTIVGYRVYECANPACKAETGIAPRFTITDGKNATNHVDRNGTPAVKAGKTFLAATHTKAGYHAYNVCAYCNVNVETVAEKAQNDANCNICKIALANQLPSPHRTYAEDEAYDKGTLSVVEIPATGHDLVAVPAKAATHNVAGHTAALVCVGCADNNGEDLAVYGGDVIAPHGNKYMIALKAPTCTTSGIACTGYDYLDANGKATKVCAYCERANISYIAPAHKIDTVATDVVTVNGDKVDVKACSVCDFVYEESVFTGELNGKSDTWYLEGYEAKHEHVYTNDADKTKEYYETYEKTSNELNGTTLPACQVAKYKVAKCQVAGCAHLEIIETIAEAPGHYIGAKKAPMSLGCQDYILGTTCSACGISITAKDDPDIVHNWGSGDNYGVVKVPTCTEPGIALRACVDCGARDPKDPDTFGSKYAAYDWAWDDEAYAYVAPALGHSPAALDSYSFSKESYNVVTYSATCTVCEQKYTEEVNILEDYVVFDVSAKDPNGSEWTANGNTIVVTIAYTAADYKFRDLTLAYNFDTKGLTFQKAEVVADFEGASTDVVVVEDEITIYTFVSAPGKTTVMSGDGVAYVELYFTVNKTGGAILNKNMSPDSIIAHVYDEDEKLVVDYTKYFNTYISEDISAYVTGDVNNDGAFTPADLLAVMDMIYGEDAQYDAIADVDKDGDVDVDDFAALKTFVLSKKTAKDYITMVTGEYVDIMPTLLAIAKEETLDADGNGVVTRSDVSALINVSSELYWYVHAAEYSWEYGAALNATMIQEADFADILVDAYNALV